MPPEPTEQSDPVGADPASPVHGELALIVGASGSGTGILAELVGTHPDVTRLNAAEALDAVGAAGDCDRLTEEHATPERATRLRDLAARRGDAGLMVLEDPRAALQVPFLRAVFPHARVVHLVRDGRDVARALEPDMAYDPWSAPRPPRWQELFERTDGLVRCALAWREVMEIVLSDLEDLDHLTLRYEDIIDLPQESEQAVRSFLGLRPDPDFHDRWARAGELARQDDEPQRYAVRRWRAVALERPVDLRVANGLIADLLERLGYDPSPPDIVRDPDLDLPRWAVFEQRRLSQMLNQRQLRVEALEQQVAELEEWLAAADAAAVERGKALASVAGWLERARAALERTATSRRWRLWWRLAGPALRGDQDPDPVHEATRQLGKARAKLDEQADHPVRQFPR